MQGIVPGELLPVVSAAVTPVVMVSAAALLTVGIANKHASMADRLRSLVSELRGGSWRPEEADNLHRQIALFRRRILLTSFAHRVLYLSIALYLVLVMLIAINITGSAAYGIFLAATALVLAAVAAEFLELELGNRTLELEVERMGLKPQPEAKPL